MFTLLWYLHYRIAMRWEGKKLRLIVFMLSLLYGISIELLQEAMNNGRSADILDVLANASGSAVALMGVWLFQKNKKS